MHRQHSFNKSVHYNSFSANKLSVAGDTNVRKDIKFGISIQIS